MHTITTTAFYDELEKIKEAGRFANLGTKIQAAIKDLSPRLKEKLKHMGQDAKEWIKDRNRPGIYA